MLNPSEKLPVIVIGYGGHGKVVIAALRAIGRVVIGATALQADGPPSEQQLTQGCGFRVMTDDALVSEYRPHEVELVLGIGSVGCCDESTRRVRAVTRLSSFGYKYVGFTHPSAWVDASAELDDTVQVHAGVVVQPGCRIGAHTILNTRSSVDHDCEIGDFCHIAPGAILSGEVKVGSGSHLGVGCTVIQSVKIGKRCFVAAGATVVCSTPDDSAVRGTPAKPFELSKK